jgi:hypothetical protein
MGDRRLLGGSDSAVVLACLIVLLLAAFAGWRARPRPLDSFYTPHGQEEPTRSDTPYTGTVPLGPWGTLPWAEVAPGPRGGARGCHQNARDAYLSYPPLCRGCGGTRAHHASVQHARPHAWVPTPIAEQLPPAWVPARWAASLPRLD